MSCSPSGPRCCPWRCGQIWWMAQGLIGGYHQAGLAHWEGGGGDNEVAKILGGLLGRNSTVQYRTQVNNHPSCDRCLRTVHSTLMMGTWERWRIWNSLSTRRCWSSTSEVALAAISYWVIYPLPYPAPSLFTPPLQSSQVELVSNFCSTNVSSCPRVLLRCFFNAGALPSTPSNSSLSAVDPRMLIQVRSSYPELTLRKNEIYTFWSQISHACKCPRWLNKNEIWVFLGFDKPHLLPTNRNKI